MKVQPIYNSKILKKGFEFASNNGSLFAASTALILSAARPLAILATPNTDKDNKRYACTKAIASSLNGYLLMLCASIPIAKAVKEIDKNPAKYLSEETVKNLKGKEKILAASKKYTFATQLFKLGIGLLVAAPKAILTCALIPPIMNKLFNIKNNRKTNNTNPSFTGKTNIPAKTIFETIKEKGTKVIAKGINSNFVQNLAEKYHNTRFEQHIISLTDAVSTTAFIHQISQSKDIKNDNKNALIYNAALSTGLSITGGYVLDSITKKPTEKFIEKFKKANAKDPKLNKYIEGIRVAKPVLILGTIYYIFIPLISTFLADKFDRYKTSLKNNN